MSTNAKRPATTPATTNVSTFLEALGSADPTPGGGSASALVGAVAAALAEMVAQLTAGKPKFQPVEQEVQAIITRLRTLRQDLQGLMREDARAYTSVATAYRLPKASDEERVERSRHIQQALAAAAVPPLQMMERTCEVLELSAQIATIGNPTVASDAGCAAILGEAAVRAAGLNVLANVVLLDDASDAERMSGRVGELEEVARDLRERTMATVHSRMGLAR